jgi:hypothetical protein
MISGVGYTIFYKISLRIAFSFFTSSSNGTVDAIEIKSSELSITRTFGSVKEVDS